MRCQLHCQSDVVCRRDHGLLGWKNISKDVLWSNRCRSSITRFLIWKKTGGEPLKTQPELSVSILVIYGSKSWIMT